LRSASLLYTCCVRSYFTGLGQLYTYVRSPSQEGVLGRDEKAYVLPCTYAVLLRMLLLPVALGHPLSIAWTSLGF